MAKRAVRFGVGDPLGRCSGTWKLWAEGRAGDVYVACRPAGNRVKVSLHASGDFREAWTRQYMEEEDIPDDERVRLQWSRLDPVNGWVYAYRVKIPESQLRPMDGIPERLAVDYWHPIPEAGRTTEFTVVIGPSEVEQGPLPGRNVDARHLATITARNGDTVALMVHDTVGSPETEEMLEFMRADTVEWLKQNGRSGWHNQRQIVSMPDRHGVGTAIELAIPDDDRAA